MNHANHCCLTSFLEEMIDSLPACMQTVQPHLNYAWDNAGEAATLARQHSASLLSASKLRAQEAWDAAGPSARNAYDTTQACASDTKKRVAGMFLLLLGRVNIVGRLTVL